MPRTEPSKCNDVSYGCPNVVYLKPYQCNLYHYATALASALSRPNAGCLLVSTRLITVPGHRPSLRTTAFGMLLR